MSKPVAASGLAIVKYTDVNWSSISAIEGHPLQYLFNRGVPLYFKINRTTHAAYTYRYIYRPTRSPGKPHPQDVDLVNWPAKGLDPRLLFLQLDDHAIQEILFTGSREVKIFTASGLALIGPESANDTGHTGLVDIDFAQCVLVNLSRYRIWPLPGEFPRGAPEVDTFDSFRIGLDDLYLTTKDLEAISQHRWGSGVERHRYPLERDDRKLPLPIYWTYQAAIAAYKLEEVNPSKVKEVSNWLRTNAPDGIMKKRWVRTAATLIRHGYKGDNKFSHEVISEYRSAPDILSLGLSRRLTCAIALAEWWLDQSDTGPEQVMDLVGRVKDAGFKRIASIDLVGMIKGSEISEKAYDNFVGRLAREEALMLARLRSAEERKSAITLKESVSPEAGVKAHDEKRTEDSPPAQTGDLKARL